jgi:hypothetical protein
MSASVRLRLLLLFAIGSTSSCLNGQTPEAAYERAHKALLAHTHDGFSPDGSADAIAATGQMWSAVADFIAVQTNANPNISAAALNHSLCLLTVEPMPREAVQESDEEQCESRRGDANEVVELGPHLLLVAPSTGETGTVFVLGERDGKSAVLWSITNTAPQRLDPHDLIGAWKANRAGEACYPKQPPDKEGGCGPLYASVGALPPDEKGRPRFYVDAGYSQGMGATIGKQTSVWRWDGNHAELEWIELYEFMIDQGIGASFDEDKGTLVIGQKGEFRTMYDCGSCIERPMVRRLLVTKSGVEDLGVRSLVPEMDAIDDFLWRLSHGRSTASVASSQAVSQVRRQVWQATQESQKIDPTFYSVGMVSDLTRLTKTGAEVCLEADDLGVLIVQMRRTADGGYFITHIDEPGGAAAGCLSQALSPAL